MPIKYRLSPTQLDTDGEKKTVYRPSVVRGEIIHVFADLVPELGEKLGHREADLRRIFTELTTLIARKVIAGNIVSFDNFFTLSPGLSGEFERDNHQIPQNYTGLRFNLKENETFSTRVSTEVRYEFIRTEAAAHSTITKVEDLTSKHSDAYHPGRTIQVTGTHLKFDPFLRDERKNITGDNLEEGIFVAGPDRQWQRLDNYSGTGPKRIKVTVDRDYGEHIELKIRIRSAGGVIQETTYPNRILRLTPPATENTENG